MKYYTGVEIINSVAGAFLFGISAGMLFIAFGVFFACFRSVIKLPIIIIRATAQKRRSKYLRSLKLVSERLGGLLQFFKDFLFISITGIGFTVLLYVFCDGIFRAYMLICVILSCVLCVRLFGGIINATVFKVLSFCVFTVAFVSTYAILPVRRVLGFVLRHAIIPLKIKAEAHIAENVNKRLLRKKKREALRFVNNIKYKP